jgi:hypothetical protein
MNVGDYMTIEELAKKTVMELKSYAKKNDIDLFGVSTKLEILEVIASFIPNGLTNTIKEEKAPIEKVALYSDRNIYWGGLGELKVGYNIVSKEASEQWITRKAVRIAQPEEVASYYGK